MISTAFTSVGCYSPPECYFDVFVDSLTSVQCSSTANAYSPMVCGETICTCGCSYYWLFSNTSMTNDICIKMCIGNGFKYAALGG